MALVLKKLRALVFLAALASCLSCEQNHTSPLAIIHSDTIRSANTEWDSEAETPSNFHSENPGELITTIEFNLKATPEEKKSLEGDLYPWISLENPKEDIPRLIDGDKIVLPYTEITVLVDYPLENPTTFELVSKTGFTRKMLITEISNIYHKIYAEEDKTSSNKVIPQEERTEISNRNRTTGKYGIYGHDLSDLDLTRVEVFKTPSGKILVTLGVDS